MDKAKIDRLRRQLRNPYQTQAEYVDTVSVICLAMLDFLEAQQKFIVADGEKSSRKMGRL